MTGFDPQDKNFETRVRTSFARQTAMATLGIEITGVTAGEVELKMPYAAAYAQQHGFIHAGIITTALDSACGYAAFSLMPTMPRCSPSNSRPTSSRRHAAIISCFARASSNPAPPSPSAKRRRLR
jgi:hypothetical protein